MALFLRIFTKCSLHDNNIITVAHNHRGGIITHKINKFGGHARFEIHLTQPGTERNCRLDHIAHV